VALAGVVSMVHKRGGGTCTSGQGKRTLSDYPSNFKTHIGEEYVKEGWLR